MSKEPITPEIIRATVARLSDITDNPDYAHRLEDKIRHDVLEAIANGCEKSRECAVEALKSSELDFPRWYS